MALERLQSPARRGVPEPDRPVARCRRHRLAVWRESHGADDGVRRALERLQRAARSLLGLSLIRLIMFFRQPQDGVRDFANTTLGESMPLHPFTQHSQCFSALSGM